MNKKKVVTAGVVIIAAVCSQPRNAAADAMVVKTVAEVESSSPGRGPHAVKLVPADRVGPGDQIVYTLEVRNTGATELVSPLVTNPVPEHMRYVAGSAVGPGAEVLFSADGGRTFDRADNLKVTGADGRSRTALAADYTHIRWRLKNSLKANSVAFVRFRTVVK